MATIVEYVVKMTDKFSPALNKMQRGMKGVNQSIHKMDQQISGLGAALGGLAILATGQKLLQLGSDFEETDSKFKTVFRSISEESEKAAKDLEKDFGLSSLASKTLLSDTGDLLSGFGFTGKMALNLSTDVQKLAVDLASFTNFAGGASGASEALTKALLGERESVKALGIAILESDVKARVKQMESMGQLEGMTMRQKKAFATLALAQEQSKNAIGDYARTSDSFANTLRRLRATAENFGVFLGKTLVKIVRPFVNILEKMGDFAMNNIEIFQDVLIVLVPMIGTIGLIVAAIKTWVVVQKILNIVLMANPIGLVIIAISALIGIIVVAYRRSETFRRIVGGLWEVFKGVGRFIKDTLVPQFKDFDFSIKGLGKTIMDSLINRFEILLKGIKGVGRAFALLFEGKFKRAAQVGGKALFNLTAGVVVGKDAEDIMNIGINARKLFKKGFDKEGKSEGKTLGDDLVPDLTGGAADPGGQLSTKVKGGGTSVTGAAPKISNLNVEKLIETLVIRAESVKESTEELKESVLNALTSALADVQTIVR